MLYGVKFRTQGADSTGPAFVWALVNPEHDRLRAPGRPTPR